jgi:hypothetical protein
MVEATQANLAPLVLKQLGMLKKYLGAALTFASFLSAAAGQSRSSTVSIPLRAVVAATATLRPSASTCSAPQICTTVRSLSADRIEIGIHLKKGGNSPHSIEIPVEVSTNARAYLLRVSDIRNDASASIWAVGSGSTFASRAQTLGRGRVFALGPSPKPGKPMSNVLHLEFPALSEDLEITVEIEATPITHG